MIGKIDKGGNPEAGVGNRIETGKKKGKNSEKRNGKPRGGGKGTLGNRIKTDKEKGRHIFKLFIV
jgi:hypothetical protein